MKTRFEYSASTITDDPRFLSKDLEHIFLHESPCFRARVYQWIKRGIFRPRVVRKFGLSAYSFSEADLVVLRAIHCLFSAGARESMFRPLFNNRRMQRFVVEHPDVFFVANIQCPSCGIGVVAASTIQYCLGGRAVVVVPVRRMIMDTLYAIECM